MLAAIVIYAVSKSWRLPALEWRRDRLVALAAILAVLALRILDGLLAAIAFSLILLLRQFAMPRVSVLGPLGATHDSVNVELHLQAVVPAGVLILCPKEPMFFGQCRVHAGSGARAGDPA